MSRTPQSRQQFAYSQGQSPTYYYDDPEGYVGDYSESDGVSDCGQTPNPNDFTELYRKNNLGNNKEVYHQGVYVRPEYYYEQPVTQHVPPPQVRVTVPAIPAAVQPQISRKRIVIPNQQQRQQYYSNEEYQYHHSLPHVSPAPRQEAAQRNPSATVVRPQQQMPQQQMMRRHPVTVRTPRYVRRPTAAAVYKRPSALCLPIACQPDPATFQRRKVKPEQYQETYQMSKMQRRPSGLQQQQAQQAQHAQQAQPVQQVQNKPKKVESKRTLNITKSRLDAILERYEKIFGKNGHELDKENSTDQQLVKNLQPRLPPSLKEKTPVTQSEQNIRNQIPEIMKNAETFEVEEISSDVLDELLSDLTEHGFNNVVEEQRQDHRKLKATVVQTPKPSSPKKEVTNKNSSIISMNKVSQTDVPVKDMPKSFNYQEIKESLTKSQSTQNDEVRSSKSEFLKQLSPTTKGRSLDDAMELHRTKSYVVNLIDTALSNHFGTNVSDKHTTTKDMMSPRNAVEILKKHSTPKLDKDLCIEIAQALTDSFTSTNTPPTPSSVDSKGSQCSCKSSLEEPTFVKQLKQMRWGHLKHIQREVRRLEELERFLDSCNVATFEKYTN